MLFSDPFINLFFRFFINLIVVIMIALPFYYRRSRRKEYVFTFIVVGITVFALSYLLSSVNLELGLALGLFGIFGIMRFRTLNVQIREMTYLFLTVTISVINALTAAGYSDILIILINLTILVITGFFELIWSSRGIGSMQIRYDRIARIRPEERDALLEDRTQRLGFRVIDARISTVDRLRDTAEIEVFFHIEERI